MKSVFYFFPFLLLIACGTTAYNNTEKGMPSEPGKCFAKCLILAQEEKEFIGEFLVYTGNQNEKDGVKYRKIITREAETKWDKRRTTRNCLSDNPDDCLIWCKVDVLEMSTEFYEVVDTALVKDFKKEKIYASTKDKIETCSEWKEVVCEKDITEKLLNDFQQSLSLKGYAMEESKEGNFDEVTKTALVQFQKDYQLPIGHLNIETLQAFGVEC